MTPKEKADYLLHKMYVVDAYDDYDDVSMEYRYAKRCALIAVDEMMKQCWDYRDIDLQASYDYWQEVKHEIEKL
jgi:hypothetical protein